MFHHQLPCPPALILAAVVLAACSKQEPAMPSAAVNPPAATAAAAPAKPVPMACEMVTPTAMSAILGAEVVARPDEGAGRTGCIYTPASGTGPAVELRVEWGAAQMAIKGVGMAGRAEPGLASPLAGLGDQAAQMGPALMIATGEDLVTLITSGVDDLVPKAKAILALVKPRL